jgi:type II secretory pathway component PulK
VVLLLVLVVIVLTIGSVYAFGRTTLLDVMSSRQRAARVRAEFLARAGIEIALRTLLDDLFMSDDLALAIESPHDPWRILSQVPIEVPGEGSLRITIQDSGSRISLNGLLESDGEPYADSRPFLMAALERIIDDMPGREEDKPYEIADLADAILDWLDRNDQTRLGDYEADYYRDLGEGSPPINRPVLTLDELGAVPGIDDLLLDSIKLYFIPYPMFPEDDQTGGVNPNTAPPHLLGMIYQGQMEKQLLDRDDVFRILKARSEGKVLCPPEEKPSEECESVASLIGLDPVFPELQYKSSIFTVRSEARYAEARACVTAVIDRSLGDEPEILFYRMGC